MQPVQPTPTAKQTIIPNKKLKAVFVELGCAAAAVIGVVMALSPPDTSSQHLYGWAAAILFGLSFIALLPQVLGKNYLVLDEHGFRIVSPYNKKFAFAWSDIVSVGMYPIKTPYGRAVEMIGFNLKSPSDGVAGAITGMNESSTGYQRAFPNSYKMRSEELVKLMEQYRSRSFSA